MAMSDKRTELTPASSHGSPLYTVPPAATSESCMSNSLDHLFLDRYKVLKVLGEGSYGRVKLAIDTETNQKVSS
ncbi:hypothetical protein HDU84_000524 [Entophlyctis sp. JEL0112]|nr:hypothetical protein HDU84_000524 [Entophlyctis sp. JEL0112]